MNWSGDQLVGWLAGWLLNRCVKICMGYIPGTPVTLNMAPVLGYLVGGSLLVLALALIAGIAWRKFQSKSPDSPVALPLKDKVALPLRSDMDDLYEMDDKNPDVVPCNKGSIHHMQWFSTSPRDHHRRRPWGKLGLNFI